LEKGTEEMRYELRIRHIAGIHKQQSRALSDLILVSAYKK